VTRSSQASDWVQREYHYARSLFDRHEIVLIPLFFEANLPSSTEFSSHNGLRFWQQDKYLENLHRLIFPGITGRKVVVLTINDYGETVWGALRQHLTERHGVEFASGGDISRGRQFLKSGYPHMLGDVRLVIAINIFHEEIKWYSEDSLKLIFEYRERTRGTRDEIVFLLL